jgi:Leucine-rich repeat (LRR) protein
MFKHQRALNHFFVVVVVVCVWSPLLWAQCGGFGQAVDNCQLNWNSGGSKPWVISTAPAYIFYGNSVAMSGPIERNQTSFIETTVTGPGTLSFYWRVSSQPLYFDGLKFEIDQELKAMISGYADSQWLPMIFAIPAGQHTFRWTYFKDAAIDAGADAGWLDKVVYTVDQYPTVSITSPPNGSVVRGTVNVQATATDDVAVSKVEFYVDNNLKSTVSQAPYQFSWNSLDTPYGPHVIQAKAYDTVNQATTASINITVDNRPAVLITSPAEGATLNGTVNVQASVTGPTTITSVELYVDNQLKATSSSASFMWNTSGYTWGGHTLMVKAYDNYNQVGTSPVVNVKVDNYPGVTFNNPSGGSTLSGDVAVSINANDDQGVAKLEFFIDGVKIGEALSGSYSYNWDTTFASNDAHQLRASAFDLAGQVTTLQITVYVNNGPSSIPESERNALISFYNNTAGPAWIHRDRWLFSAGTECTWYGVTCNPGKSHITGINLYGNNLYGTIPTEIAGLPNLTSLNLSGNTVIGNLPNELTTLTNLTQLVLYNNRLTGSIPSQIGNLTKLQVFNLTNNSLSGNIPSSLGNCLSLTDLRLSNNRFAGGIIPEIGNLSLLQYLYLDRNQFAGSIPAALGNLKLLLELSLSTNQLEGVIPLELGNLTRLVFLDASKNQLIGGIPRTIGSLTLLQVLDLHENSLNERIPSSIGGLSNLTRLDLSDNDINESIPVEIGNLKNLVYLHLSGNQLSGSIPLELGSLTNLLELHLDRNELSGSIPASLGNLALLTSFQAYKNGLTGTIPSELTGMQKLVYLDLGQNQLTGEIPGILFKLPKLMELLLDSNQFFGELPIEIGQFPGIRLLLSANRLEGLIPIEIATLPLTVSLNLSWNAFLPIPCDSDYSALRTWMNKVEPDYIETQTLPPDVYPHPFPCDQVTPPIFDRSISISAASATSVQLKWIPVDFNAPGGYRVFYSRTHLGPFALGAEVVGKGNGEAVVTGLYPSTWYYFYVQTYTEPLESDVPPWRLQFQQNQVTSASSEPLFIRTSDVTIPLVTIVEPQNNAVISGVVDVKTTVTSGTLIREVKFFVDDRQVASVTAAPFNWTWNTALFTNAAHVLRVQAFDANGIWGSTSITVNVANPQWIIPSTARISGVGGAFWTTDVYIANKGIDTVSFILKFLGHDVDGSAGPEKSFTIAAGKEVVFTDVLNSVFGLSAGYGAIQVISVSPTLSVQSQTWTPMGTGSYGQSVPSFYSSDVISSAQPGVISGVRENLQFRTNLVLASGVPFQLPVDIKLKSSEGVLLGSRQIVLPPRGMTQISQVIRSLGVTEEVASASIILSTAVPGGSFAAYASMIDNITNDPRTLIAQKGKSWVLPSSARVFGANNALWLTDLSVTNWGSAEAGFALHFGRHDQDGASGPSKLFTLGPGKTLSFVDVLGTLFGVDLDYGSITMLTSSTTLVMQGQNYTTRSGGSYGQSVPGYDWGKMVQKDLPLTIIGIREDPSFRTNLVLANAILDATVASVQLYSADGVLLGSNTYYVPAQSMTQVSSVVRALGYGGDVIGGRLVISTSAIGSYIAVYASAIDNATNDPRTLLPQ